MAAVQQYLTRHLPSKETLRQRCTSIRAWQLPKQPGSLAPDDIATNPDCDPTPESEQTWSYTTYVMYWMADMVNLGTVETASSIIAVGLTWADAIGICLAGTFCVAVPMVLNGAIGADLHIPFSVVVRSSFGYYFGYFCIVSRFILACFWLGIQGANGAYAMNLMISSIWPSFNNLPNTIPASQGVTTQYMVSYLLFWLIQLPLLLIPPTKLRWLFITKLIVAPTAALATMAWCIHRAGGSGQIFTQTPTVNGQQYTLLWLSSMSAVTGSWATLACNIPDFSRYTKSPKSTIIQLPVIPIVFTATATIGIITTSAAQVIYGESLWNPLDIIAKWQVHGHGGRAATFFAAAAWYIAQVTTNITANSISAANDLTVLFPRWINITRGCMIAAVVGGWVLVPWKILSSAQTFLAFMAGYSVFLAPIAGVMAADYWLVKHRKIDIPALYDPRARYRYDSWWGVNPHALIAFLVAVTPNLPGLAFSINPMVKISEGAEILYAFDYVYGFVCSVVVYTLLSWGFPFRSTLVPETIRERGEGRGAEVVVDGEDGLGEKVWEGKEARWRGGGESLQV